MHCKTDLGDKANKYTLYASPWMNELRRILLAFTVYFVAHLLGLTYAQPFLLSMQPPSQRK